MKATKRDYEEWLNELGAPEDDKKSNGGRVPDNCKYGSWLRRNDPIAFQVGFNEWQQILPSGGDKRRRRAGLLGPVPWRTSE